MLGVAKGPTPKGMSRIPGAGAVVPALGLETLWLRDRILGLWACCDLAQQSLLSLKLQLHENTTMGPFEIVPNRGRRKSSNSKHPQQMPTQLLSAMSLYFR